MAEESPPAPQDELAAKALAVHGRLLEVYGAPEWREPLPALDELVSTILSQNTNDRNRDAAFDALKRRFPSWEAVRDADPEEVIAAIRPAGLANQKGPRIQAVLRQIADETGGLSLDFLKDWPAEKAHAWLMRFKGVGPKTAACVLLFSLKKPAFPVDTHIFRVTKRLGLIGNKITIEKAHKIMEAMVPSQKYHSFHINLIRHGRLICHPRAPECTICVINRYCKFFKSTHPELAPISTPISA